MKKVWLWILSIILGLFALLCFSDLPATWGGLLFIAPAVLANPKFQAWAKTKNIRFKWPVYLASALVPVVCFSGSMAALSPVKPAQVSQKSSIVSSKAIVSKPLKSSSVPSSQPSAIPTVKSGAALKVHYIDVGQGDSEFLELPNGQTMLIDAGIPEQGQNVVNYIKGLGHSKIDYLIATHPHADHIGGMTDVVNSFSIGKFYMPKKTTTTKVFTDLIAALKRKNLGINVAKAGVNILKTGNLSIDMLAPVNITGDDLNQYSAVVKITYGDNKFLFMGDAGEPSESQITADVSADVLKVGHHGSNTATSQAFLNKVHPKYAVIEVGKGNSYGHPTAATLSKLQNIGATIYRTDNDGTIIFTSDAKTVTVDKQASSVKENAPPSDSGKVVAGAAVAGAAGAITRKPSPSKNRDTTPVSPAIGNNNTTVYITKTGKRYHTANCSSLRKSKIAISLSDAKSRGYTPCENCHPPE